MSEHSAAALTANCLMTISWIHITMGFCADSVTAARESKKEYYGMLVMLENTMRHEEGGVEWMFDKADATPEICIC